MSKAISKKKIKEYKKWLEEKLTKLYKESTKLERIQEKDETAFYGETLQELYYQQEKLSGEIRACTYILNNC